MITAKEMREQTLVAMGVTKIVNDLLLMIRDAAKESHWEITVDKATYFSGEAGSYVRKELRERGFDVNTLVFSDPPQVQITWIYAE